MKKYLSLLLCVMMILSLCACGNPQTEAPVAQTETAVPAEEAVEAETAESVTLSMDDSTAMLESIPGLYDADAIVLNADGMEIPWSVYSVFLQDSLNSFLSYTGLPVDYSIEMESGKSLDEAIRDELEQYIRRLSAAASHSTLTKEEVDADFEAYWEELVEEFGGEDALNAQLVLAGYTRSSLKFFTDCNVYVDDSFSKAYGENFEDITDEMVADWVEKNGYIRTKHILIMTYDSMSEEEKAAAKQKLEDLRKELLALEDDEKRETLFDDQMSILTEDTGITAYPDGYTYTAGTMVTEFEDAAFALEDYAVSEVVETAYGYHLLMGLPVEKDNIVEYDSSSYEPLTVANKVANENYTLMVRDWAEDVKVSYSKEFENFTVQSIFDNYEQILANYYADHNTETSEDVDITIDAQQNPAVPTGVDGMAEDGKLHVYPYGLCEEADVSDSSLIRAARYYESGHLILSVDGKEEAFVNVPAEVWEQFKASDVKGTFYKKYIKDNAGYAVEGVPAGKEVSLVVE